MKVSQLITQVSLALLACFATLDLARAAKDANTCRAEGATLIEKKDADGNVTKEWTLDCGGSCPLGEQGRPDCRERNGADNKGSYWACSCDDNATPNNTCCQLVLRDKKDAEGHTVYTLGTKGDCPSCPASGACQVHEGTGEAQAVCD